MNKRQHRTIPAWRLWHAVCVTKCSIIHKVWSVLFAWQPMHLTRCIGTWNCVALPKEKTKWRS